MPRLSPEDRVEIEKFRQYLADFRSGMTHQEFASKWNAYLEVSEADAVLYSMLKRLPIPTQPTPVRHQEGVEE